jgi:hypothetical protein
MVSRSISQVGTWTQRIVFGALMFALAGLSAPATTSAAIYQDDTPEVIEIEDEAPWDPTTGMGGHNGEGVPNSYPSGGDSGGGGGGVPSGGGSTNDSVCSKYSCSGIRYKLNQIESECIDASGSYWVDFDPYDGVVSICQYQALDGTWYRDRYYYGEYDVTFVLRDGKWVIDY